MSVRRISRAFFACEMEEKARWKNRTVLRGYRKVEIAS